MRLQKKSYSRLSLVDLLRRKRSDLSRFLTDSGIVSFERLRERCESMGVLPPSEVEFNEARGNPSVHNFSSPSEGIVVLDAPLDTSVSNDVSTANENEEVASSNEDSEVKAQESSKSTEKKKKKKQLSAV